jgi:hypothetical protein
MEQQNHICRASTANIGVKQTASWTFLGTLTQKPRDKYSPALDPDTFTLGPSI